MSYGKRHLASPGASATHCGLRSVSIELAENLQGATCIRCVDVRERRYKEKSSDLAELERILASDPGTHALNCRELAYRLHARGVRVRR